MKCASVGMAAFAGALCLAVLVKADPPPQPHAGSPPVFYYSTNQTVEFEDDEPSGLAIQQADVVVGWNYDSEDEVYVSSDPTVTFINVVDTNRHVFYLYHGSTLQVFNSLLNSDISAFDNSEIILGSNSIAVTVSLSDSSTIDLGPNSKVVQLKLFDGTHVAAEGTNFLEGSLQTNDSATAELSFGKGEPGLQASGHSSITASNTDLRGISAIESGTVTVNTSDVSGGILAGGQGFVSMTLGELGAAEANGDGVIQLQQVHGVKKIHVGDRGVGVTEGLSAVSMAGGSLNSAELTVINKGTVALGEVGGSASRVTVREKGSLDIKGSAFVITGSFNGSGESITKLENMSILQGMRVSESASLALDGVSLIGSVTVTDRATFTLSSNSRDSTISGGVFSFGGSPKVSLLGGVVNSIVQAESGFLTLQGVNVNGPVNVGGTALGSVGSGSNVVGDLAAQDTSRLVISGGRINGNLLGVGDSTTFMSGGLVLGTPIFLDNAVLNWSGGGFGYQNVPTGAASFASTSLLSADGAAAAGEPLVGLKANGNSTINVIGYDLEAVLVDPNYEDSYSVYQLAGRLADGTPLAGELIFVLNERDASLHLIPAVPEPGSLALFAAAVLSLAGGRRRR